MPDPNAQPTAPSSEGGTANPNGQVTPVDPNAAPAAGTEPPAGTEPKQPEVPESYSFTMPEGVELDKAAADEFSAVAKELKLDQATAQKVADVGARMAQRQVEQHVAKVTSWTEAVKVDKEIGGDKLAENLVVARKAIERFGTPELRDVLEATGLGSHPEVVRAFFRAGLAIREDGFVSGAPAGGQVDPAKKLFPNMN